MPGAVLRLEPRGAGPRGCGDDVIGVRIGAAEVPRRSCRLGRDLGVRDRRWWRGAVIRPGALQLARGVGDVATLGLVVLGLDVGPAAAADPVEESLQLRGFPGR